ncbi:MAG TPA: GNAT family N-acetyltransferase, partial [Aggregatilineales bacterium]|nr:GNAT family N-acetyltransferase [Aggregatilineales bacterium]
MTSIFDFSTFPILTTERLILRRLHHDDAGAIMELFSDPQVLRFLNNSPTDTLKKATQLINWLDGAFDKQEAVQWAFVLRDENRFIGTGGNYAWDRDDRHIDIGYNILPKYWGKGYATEASHAMIKWTFENMNVHRIQSDCTDGHIASERVMLKCGFKFEGISRQSCWEHGRFVD